MWKDVGDAIFNARWRREHRSYLSKVTLGGVDFSPAAMRFVVVSCEEVSISSKLGLKAYKA
jgi:hypothetical protein